MARTSKDEYIKEETERRFVIALRASRVVGHKERSEMKLGKRSGGERKSPTKRKAVGKAAR
jgi:hypothetical protein